MRKKDVEDLTGTIRIQLDKKGEFCGIVT